MLKSVFGSILGKFSVAALLVCGVAGGLAVTGSLPGFGMSGSYSVASVAPAGSTSPGVTLDFPTSILGPQAPATEAPVEVIEEVVVVPAKASAATAPAAALPAGPQCVGDVTAALNAILTAIPLVTTAEQGQVLLGQATAVAAAANACLAEAQQVRFTGVGAVTQLVDQVAQAVNQIQALPVLASLAPGQAAGSPDLAGGIVGGVGSVVNGGLNLVGDGLGMLGTGLNLLTKPLK